MGFEYNAPVAQLQDRIQRWLGEPGSERREALVEWLSKQGVPDGIPIWLFTAGREELHKAVKHFNIRAKIGLALSGGGFRASIVHLGVIRRLEELGIMKDVNVISTVSGGSIIGAYYVCEMQKRLRKHRDVLKNDPASLDSIRLEIFEEIADDFFKVLQHNLRTRALVFSLMYHPLLFVRSLWPTYSRSDIIQKEYDKWLFDGNPLDQLPSATPDKDDKLQPYMRGPKLVINTTSLLTGERKSFSREPISTINELKKVNRNVLPLARVVGASAGVPGLFPPTLIAGDQLVDGGVSDNQGVDGLLHEEDTDNVNFDLILVSDASGQIEQINRTSSRAIKVLARTMSVLQHEIRNKELQRLLDWRGNEKDSPREFAFIHLFLNCKDRGEEHRVPSEYICALGRIRTDLDQFSMVEREALMYHGYTLIDSQLRTHCKQFLESRGLGETTVPMRIPPLFRDKKSDADESDPKTTSRDEREGIKKELETGATGIFLLRSIKKHGGKAALVVAAWVVLPFVFVFLPFYPRIGPWVEQVVGAPLMTWWNSIVPNIAGTFLENYITVSVDKVIETAAFLAAAFIVLFVLLFITYVAMRHLVLRWDQSSYLRHTGTDYSVHWKCPTREDQVGKRT